MRLAGAALLPWGFLLDSRADPDHQPILSELHLSGPSENAVPPPPFPARVGVSARLEVGPETETPVGARPACPTSTRGGAA
jgi:hypothetical protein